MVAIFRTEPAPSEAAAVKTPSSNRLVCLRDVIAEDMVMQLARRSAYIQTQVNVTGKAGAVKIPERTGLQWVKCFNTPPASLRVTDDATLTQFLKAAFYFQDEPMIEQLCLLLGHRLMDTACSEQPSRVKTECTTQVLERLPLKVATRVLQAAPGTFLRNFIHLPNSLKPVAALAEYPALATVCAPVAAGARIESDTPTIAICVDPSHGDVLPTDMEAREPSPRASKSCSKHYTATEIWLHEGERTAGTTKNTDSVFCLESRDTVASRLVVTSSVLQNTTIKLPDSVCLVFEEAHMHLKNVTFQGGAVVCINPSCNILFEDCTFEQCGLVVLGGAQATLRAPQFLEMDISMQGLSICADGIGSSVVVEAGGAIFGGVQGVLVQGGASLRADALNINKVTHNGVEAKDETSEVKLTGCSVTDSGQAAVWVHGGATGSLDRCTLSGVKTLQGGLLVGGPGSHADAMHCHFMRNYHAAVSADDHGSVRAVSCMSFGNGVQSLEPHAGGYTVTDGGTMEVTECNSDSDIRGCVVAHHGHLLCDTVKVSRSSKSGFVVEEGGNAMLRECSSNECGGSGMHVFDDGSVLDAECCIVRKNQQYGVHAHGDVLVTLTSCHSSGNRKEGWRAYSGAQVIATCSSTRGDGGAGVSDTDGGRLSLEECTVNNNVFQSNSLPEPMSRPVASHVAVRKSLHMTRPTVGSFGTNEVFGTNQIYGV